MMAETSARFNVLGPIVNELTLLQDGVCSLKRLGGSNLKSILDGTYQKQINEQWAKLQSDVLRHKDNKFY